MGMGVELVLISLQKLFWFQRKVLVHQAGVDILEDRGVCTIGLSVSWLQKALHKKW